MNFRLGLKLPRYLGSFALWPLFVGCTSAEERCAEAQAVAETKWAAYVQSLATEVSAAQADVAAYEEALKGEVGFRLKQLAKSEADRLHDKTTSAWHRAYDARLKAACAQIPECASLRVGERAAQTLLASLTGPLAQARHATKAVRGTANDLEAAMARVPLDPTRPARGEAQQAGDTVLVECSVAK